MVPSRKLEKLIGGIFARYAEITGIEIYAYCVLSNHFHMVVRSPKSNLDEFFENTDREIARRVNWKNQRLGTFFEGPYKDKKILSSQDLFDAFLYVTVNPVKHGLVEHPSEWPGFNSYQQCLTERPRTMSFTRHSIEDPAERVTHHTLRLAILPQLKNLAASERRQYLHEAIEARVRYWRQERRRLGRGFLGVERVKNQVPGSIPQTVTRSRMVGAYSKNAVLLREERIRERERRLRYFEASRRYRMGEYTVEFPDYTYKPPLHRKPRSAPFQELPGECFKQAS